MNVTWKCKTVLKKDTVAAFVLRTCPIRTCTTNDQFVIIHSLTHSLTHSLDHNDLNCVRRFSLPDGSFSRLYDRADLAWGNVSLVLEQSESTLEGLFLVIAKLEVEGTNTIVQIQVPLHLEVLCEGKDHVLWPVMADEARHLSVPCEYDHRTLDGVGHGCGVISQHFRHVGAR